jgi:hypothetical protein
MKPDNGKASNTVAKEQIDLIEILDGKDEKAVLAAAREKAVQCAVDAGAAKDDVKIVAVEKIPLQYTHNRATRIIVKAVGRLAVPEVPDAISSGGCEVDDEATTDKSALEGSKSHVPDAAEPTTKPSLLVNLHTYQPEVRDGTWYISEVDLELIATGTGVLGTGGGGPSYHELLQGLRILRSGGKGKMRVVSPASLKASDLVCFGSWYGAPSVINERVGSGREISTGIDTLRKTLGLGSFHAVLTDEM